MSDLELSQGRLKLIISTVATIVDRQNNRCRPMEELEARTTLQNHGYEFIETNYDPRLDIREEIWELLPAQAIDN